jgi:hypothetical protein
MIPHNHIKIGMRVRLARDFKQSVCKQRERPKGSEGLVRRYGNSLGTITAEAVAVAVGGGWWIKWDDDPDKNPYVYPHEIEEVVG